MKVFEQRFAGRLSALVMNNLKMKFFFPISSVGSSTNQSESKSSSFVDSFSLQGAYPIETVPYFTLVPSIDRIAASREFLMYKPKGSS